MTIAQFVTICATVVLSMALLYLAMTGRLHWLFALLAAALPFTRRVFSLLRFLPFMRQLSSLYTGARTAAGAARGPQSGNRSDIQTRFLSMVLDHDSGKMEGKILEGQFAGDLLSQLNSRQLLSFLAECQVDTDSVHLLESYLDRIDPAWRESQQQSGGNGNLNERLALEILGLQDGASREEIIEAHRHLMQKLHPDRGGSTYLAAKLNEAKEYLLG